MNIEQHTFWYSAQHALEATQIDINTAALPAIMQILSEFGETFTNFPRIKTFRLLPKRTAPILERAMRAALYEMQDRQKSTITIKESIFSNKYVSQSELANDSVSYITK